MAKNYDDWQNLIKSNKIPSVIAFAGPEKAFIDDALSTIKKQVLTTSAKDFNYDKISGESTNISKIITTAKTLPMLSDRRLIEVNNSDKITIDNIKLLEKFLQNPPVSAVVVFIFTSLNLRSSLVKLLQQNAWFAKFDHPHEKSLLTIIASRAKKYNLHLDQESIYALNMCIGGNILLLDRSLEKIQLIDKSTINVDDILAQTAQYALADAFKLATAIALGHKQEAMKALFMLKQNKEMPLKIIGLMAWQLRQTIHCFLLIDEAKSEYEISKSLSLFGRRLKNTMLAANSFKLKTHIARLLALKDLDIKLKSTHCNDWLCLERVVLQLCSLSKK